MDFRFLHLGARDDHRRLSHVFLSVREVLDEISDVAVGQVDAVPRLRHLHVELLHRFDWLSSVVNLFLNLGISHLLEATERRFIEVDHLRLAYLISKGLLSRGKGLHFYLALVVHTVACP